MVGEVEGRHCVIIDDMIDTAGTIVRGRRPAGRLTAPTRSGPWRPTPSSRRPPSSGSSTSPISRVVVTDTLPLAPDIAFEKLEVLSVAKIIANAIDAVFEDTSVSDIFGGENLV